MVAWKVVQMAFQPRHPMGHSVDNPVVAAFMEVAIAQIRADPYEHLCRVTPQESHETHIQ